MIGIRQSLDLIKFKNKFTERGLAALNLVKVDWDNTETNCAAFSAVAEEVEVEGKATGNTVNSKAAATESRKEVKRLQKMVESQTKPLAPFFLVNEAVPDVIVTRTRGNTIKIPIFRVTFAIKFIAL